MSLVRTSRLMSTVYIGIGTNLGDRHKNLKSAVELLKGYINIEKISSIYETPPMGFEADTSFYNIVLSGNTELQPHQLLRKNQEIEREMGRVYYQDGQYHSRIIDLDILLYDDKFHSDAELKLPHPHIFERNFVLLPLLEIAPQIKVPGNPNKSYSDYLKKEMQNAIKKIENRVLTPC